MNKWYVITWFYNNGKTKGQIFSIREAEEENLGFYDGQEISNKQYDRYCEAFPTYDEARCYLNDLKNA